MTSQATTLTELLQILETGDSDAQLSIGEVLEVIGERGYGPLVLILALIATLPTGAVPGVPSVCGVAIALVSAQLVVGKRWPWLPKRLRDVSIRRDRYAQVAERITPWTRRLDGWVRPRLAWLSHDITNRFIGLLCIVLGLCMIPLEILPFAAAAPASGIALMGLGLTSRDGCWVLAGLVPAALGVWLVWRVLV